jgi:hypothetical protein
MASRMLRPIALVASLATIAIVALSGPAGAQAPANTQIAGIGTFDPDVVCTDMGDEFTILMKGSLVGCWYTTVLNVVQETSSGIYQERGTETFVGCLVEDGVEVACGSFDTTYFFNAKYAPDGSELHGRCTHPIVSGSGTGGFEGATGRVDFKDDVETGEYVYRGHISLA